jgi:hypothetical protein
MSTVEKKGIETPPPVWTSPRQTKRERWLQQMVGKGNDEDGNKQGCILIICFSF